jgi:predicted nucleotidyltransferase
MLSLPYLSGKGSYKILRRLSTGDARFKDLNSIVRNTRTLTRRLREMEQAGLIRKTNGFYSISEAGFEILMRFYDASFELDHKWVNLDEFKNLKYDWLRIPLKRLVKMFLDEFEQDIVSIALYGSTVKGLFRAGESDIDMLYIVENEAKDLLTRENKVFKRFYSTYEYKVFDRLFRMKGFYGYPEITVAFLRRREAVNFQPIYLDMISHRAILYDKDGFLACLVQRLRDELKKLGSKRIEYADGSWCWVLKPGLKAGETFGINLGGG